MIVFGYLDVGLNVRSRMTLRVETDLLLDDVTEVLWLLMGGRLTG